MQQENIPLLVKNLYFQFSSNWDEKLKGTIKGGMPILAPILQQLEQLEVETGDLLK